jgi:hypothetical protein
LGDRRRDRIGGKEAGGLLVEHSIVTDSPICVVLLLVLEDLRSVDIDLARI